MITVTLSGLPEMGEDAKRSLFRNCVAAICLEKDWDLKKRDFIFEFSPSTIISANETHQINVVVHGFPIKPRDGRIRNLFAHVLGTKLREWYPDIFIRVRVPKVDSEEGFWSSDRKPNPYQAVRELERMLGPKAGVGDECLDYRRY